MTGTPKSRNITWHPTAVDRAARETLNGHRGVVIWFTGLSASGKSTLANAVERALYARGIHGYILDGDNIRHGLNKDLGFSPEDREENIRRIGEVAHLFAEAGLLAMTAFISPYRKDRDLARGLNEPGRFIEVWCRCSVDACASRDPKGLYKKAFEGKIPEFTGVSAPYEEPLAPELVVDTDRLSIEDSVAAV
ncbi:MAG: adenylyl-sulfate kinase, partial [Deltaproteobacteria bacterium]|nr:adenylyl-sulfate kinase [Deltaproteobacteria bacterium]